MNTEEAKKAGADASKRYSSGGYFRRNLPYSPYAMALAGLAMVGGLWYFTMYDKKKPESNAGDVTGVSAGATDAHTRPRK